MSKRKRNVAYLKPEEPAFIARMKAEAGYKEGPTVDTKREVLSADDEDSDDRADDEPQVVVLNEGDLTAEEANKAKEDKEQGPADLSQRVVFRKPNKPKKGDTNQESKEELSESKQPKKEDLKEGSKRGLKSATSKKLKIMSTLSFNEDDDVDDS